MALYLAKPSPCSSPAQRSKHVSLLRLVVVLLAFVIVGGLLLKLQRRRQ